MLAFLLETLIIGSAQGTGGLAFGARRFLDLFPFAVIGLAAVAARLGPRFDWPVAGVLCAWNITMISNFQYVIGAGHDPGYLGLLRGQLQALPHLPKLFAKGAVVRDLLLWRQAHTRFDPVGGISLLVLEAACLGAALLAATRPPRAAASPPDKAVGTGAATDLC